MIEPCSPVRLGHRTLHRTRAVSADARGVCAASVRAHVHVARLQRGMRPALMNSRLQRLLHPRAATQSRSPFFGSRTYPRRRITMATRRPSEPTRGTKPATPKSANKSAKSPTSPAPTVPASAPVASSPPRSKPEATQTEPAQATPASTAAPTPTPSKGTSKTKSASSRVAVSPERRRAMIAESAYLRAERRGFAPGHEVDDWFAAEREVDALLSAGSNASQPQ
jgi:type IV secretory pathway VirB10-like protein